MNYTLRVLPCSNDPGEASYEVTKVRRLPYFLWATPSAKHTQAGTHTLQKQILLVPPFYSFVKPMSNFRFELIFLSFITTVVCTPKMGKYVWMLSYYVWRTGVKLYGSRCKWGESRLPALITCCHFLGSQAAGRATGSLVVQVAGEYSRLCLPPYPPPQMVNSQISPKHWSFTSKSVIAKIRKSKIKETRKHICALTRLLGMADKLTDEQWLGTETLMCLKTRKAFLHIFILGYQELYIALGP